MTCTGGGVNVRVGRLEGRGQYSSTLTVGRDTSAVESRRSAVGSSTLAVGRDTSVVESKRSAVDSSRLAVGRSTSAEEGR